MKVMKPAFLFLSLALSAAFSANASEDIAREEERAALFLALKNAPNEAVANAAVTAIWELWQTAPDEKAQALLDRARERMRVADFTGAMEQLDELVEYAPEYSEGWNARATAHFLQGDYDLSLEDVAETLELEPKHFGALAGKAMILMRQGRAQLSQKALREAAEINPFLRERRLIIPTPE